MEVPPRFKFSLGMKDNKKKLGKFEKNKRIFQLFYYKRAEKISKNCLKNIIPIGFLQMFQPFSAFL